MKIEDIRLGMMIRTGLGKVGKVKEIKDYRNLLKNGDQAVQKVYIYDSFDRVKEMIYTDLETEKVMEIKTHRT